MSFWRRNLETGRQIYTWPAHGRGRDQYGNGVTDLLMDPDGSTLYSAGSDGRVKAWESIRPSADLVEKRQLVAQARKALDRSTGAYPSDQLLAELRQDTSIPSAALSYALQIADARGDLIQRKNDVDAIGDELTAVNLSPDWLEQIRTQNQIFLRAADQLVEAIEASVGTRLDRISEDDFDAAGWLVQANELVKLPVGDTQMQRLLAELLDRYPESALAYHLRASLYASRSQWGDASRELEMAIQLSLPDSQLRIGLLCQLGLLRLYTREEEKVKQIRNELLSAPEDGLPPRIQLRLARFHLLGQPDSSELERAATLVQAIPEETLELAELPWLGIARARLAALEGDPARALSVIEPVLESIPDGPYGNYARVAAFYCRGTAAKRTNNRELEKKSWGGVGFVQMVQPFTHPNTKTRHRSWEDWLCSVLAGRAAGRED